VVLVTKYNYAAFAVITTDGEFQIHSQPQRISIVIAWNPKKLDIVAVVVLVGSVDVDNRLLLFVPPKAANSVSNFLRKIGLSRQLQ
jgi:hypothetical protein